jgi:hypothetical protein
MFDRFGELKVLAPGLGAVRGWVATASAICEAHGGNISASNRDGGAWLFKYQSLRLIENLHTVIVAIVAHCLSEYC